MPAGSHGQFIASALVAFAFCLQPSGAFAQGDGGSSQDDDAKKSFADKLDELETLIRDLKANQGTDSVDKDGGKAEANLLAAAVIKGGANWVNKEIKGKIQNRTVVITDNTGALGLEDYLLIDASIDAFTVRATLLAAELAKQKKDENAGDGGADPDASINSLAVIPTLASILKLLSAAGDGNSTIKNLPIDQLTDEQFVKAVAAVVCKAPRECVSPSLTVVTSLNGNPLYERLQALHRLMMHISTSSKAKNAEVSALTKEYSAFLALISKADQEKHVPLVEAIRGSKFLGERGSNGNHDAGTNKDSEKERYYLRLGVSQTGGTLVERKNLWTALGASRIAITGMAHIEYTLSDESGRLISSNTAACGTGLTAFSQVQRELMSEVKCASENLYKKDDEPPAP